MSESKALVSRLLRQKLKKEEQREKEGKSTQQRTTTPSDVCWLCENNPPSTYQLSEQVPLCLLCYKLTYVALIRPHIIDRRAAKKLGKSTDAFPGLELAQRVNSLEKGEEVASIEPSASKRLKVAASGTFGAGGSQTATTATAVPSWACPKCTFVNVAAAPRCAVCATISPLTIMCVHCNAPAFGPLAKVVCPSAPKFHHQIWTCETCTYQNTVQSGACCMCRSYRYWTCAHCKKENLHTHTTDTPKCIRCGRKKGAELNPPLQPTVQPQAAKPKASDDEIPVSVLLQLGIPLEEIQREQRQQKEMEEAKNRLNKRLQSLGVEQAVQSSDGNCLFRALANQLLSDPQHHALVRHLVVEHMKTHPEAFGVLFGTKEEFDVYLAEMRRLGTWGDELSLKAAAEAFCVFLHVITSDKERWHLTFSPFEEGSKKETAMEVPHIFLCYLYPVHYNDVVPPPVLPQVGSVLFDELVRLRGVESTWDEPTSATFVQKQLPVDPTLSPPTSSGNLLQQQQQQSEWIHVRIPGQGSPREAQSTTQRGLTSTTAGDFVVIAKTQK